MSIFEDFIAPAAHTAWGAVEGLGSMGVSAFHALEHSPAGKLIPGVATGVGLATADKNLYQAYNSEGNERWDHLGAAALGALGAIPMVGSVVGALELGTNAAVSSGWGGHGGMHGAEHDGAMLNQQLGSMGHNLYADLFDDGKGKDTRYADWDFQRRCADAGVTPGAE